jgi:glycosyltransferase involved in cell wall biosynthesis
MKTPTVSIVMPVYNSEKYLQQTLDSLLSQTFKNYEFIAVIDGSTDRSPEILEKFVALPANKKHFCQVIEQANAGAGAARNAGIKAARGKYLWIIDADDFFEPNALELLVSAAETYKADLVLAQADQYLQSEKRFRPTPWVFKSDWFPPYQAFNHRAITGSLFKSVLGWTWDKLFSRDLVERKAIRFQEIRSSNDLVFTYAALASANSIAVVYDTIAHYRFESENSVSKTRDQHWQNFYLALIELKQNLVSYDLWPELERQFIDYAVNFINWHLRTLNPKSKTEAGKHLRGEWGRELGITGKNRSYFYDPNEYDEYLELLK